MDRVFGRSRERGEIGTSGLGHHEEGSDKERLGGMSDVGGKPTRSHWVAGASLPEERGPASASEGKRFCLVP